MLRYGIPSYKLEKDLLAAEIDVIRQLGVEIRCGVEVGKDVTIEDLREQGYKGFYAAIGCQRGRKPGISGENAEGAYTAVDFLRKAGAKESFALEGDVVVVGGGNIATRRIRTLLQFTRNITAIAPKSTMELQELGKTGYVNLITRPVKRSDFDMAYMVIAATNDWKLNDEIYRVCKEEGIYVNVADDKSKCDFYFPGIYMKDEVVIGITASGLDHSRAKKVRLAIQEAMEASDDTDNSEE